MYMVVIDFLESNASTTSALPEFASLFPNLKTIVNQIQKNLESQGLDRSGIVLNTDRLKNRLMDSALDISRKISAYAVMTDNQVFLKSFNSQNRICITRIK